MKAAMHKVKKDVKSDDFTFSFKCPLCKNRTKFPIKHIGEILPCPACHAEVNVDPQGPFFENLNMKQKKAVATCNGIIRVNAGAGTGKTKVLISRLARMISLGIPEKNILSVTFTNKAANEMKSRIKKILQKTSVATRISTFHGFCYELLREDISHLNWGKKFSIIDEDDQKRILESIYDDFQIPAKVYTYDEAIKDISGYKHKISYVADLTSPTASDICAKTYNTRCRYSNVVITNYLKNQQKNFCLDFDDLILFAVYILENFQEVKEKWNSEIRYIQVDEFQDVSAVQMRLLNLLLGKNHNLFVVGDPDQNIYSWRGAKQEIFNGLEDFAIQSGHPFMDIALDDNYRSKQPILDISNMMIANNPRSGRGNLLAVSKTRGKSVKPIFAHWKEETEEIKWVIEQIKGLKKKGENGKEVAVLFRSKTPINKFSMTLDENGIKNKIVSGTPFYKIKEIKEVINFLRLIDNPDNDNAFRACINVPRRGMSKTRIDVLRKYACDNKCSLFEALRDNLGHKFFLEEAITQDMPKIPSDGCTSYRALSPNQFVKMILSLSKKSKDMKLADVLDTILKESGYESYMLLHGDEEQKENIAELKNIIAREETLAEEKLNLHNFLQKVTRDPDNDGDENDDEVKLMTIHAAKGLEFKYVFLPFFNEGVLPSGSAHDYTGIEEERRIAYVAFTRAKKQLFLSGSDGNGCLTFLKPSRFLAELRPELLNIKGVFSLSFWVDKLKQVLSPRAVDGKSIFSVGDVVLHDEFGEGTVLSINDGIADVQFEDDQTTLVRIEVLKKKK